ncbi:MAG: family N-acetyltransferase [Clostridiales bacterium]|jgi:diamine N-acetyltransferase|nr:family N-acetyltransferase [Clostridiales bacterium]
MIKGKKTYIRAVELEDGRLLSAWLNDRESNQHLDIIYPVSKRDADSFLLEGDNDNSKRMFIIDNEDRKSIGLIILSNIKWEYRNCEMGIVIYDKNFRGKGYGKDGLNATIQFIFEEMNMHLIYLKVAEDNHIAIKLYEDLGFDHEGVLKDRYFKAGKYKNIIVMSKLQVRMIK